MSHVHETGHPETAVSEHDHILRTDHLLTSIGSRTVSGGAVTIMSHGLKLVMSIGATAVLARLLDPKDYGLVGMAVVVTAFAALFKDMGLSLATVQRSKISHDQVTNLFWVNVGVSTGMALIIIGLAPGVAWLYGEPRLRAITMVTACGFVFSGLAVQHEALLKRQMRFTAMSAIGFTATAMGYAVGITLALRGAGYWALVFSQLALLATTATGVWLACAWRPGLPRRNSGTRSMLAFGRNVTGYAVMNYLGGNVDSLLIGRLCGAEQLGFYGKAAQLTALPTDQISDPIAAVTVPVLSRLNDDAERYRQAYMRIMQKVQLITIPVIAFMIGSSDWIVLVILGPKWAFTSQILMLMAIPYLMQPINSMGWLMVSQGRTRDLVTAPAIGAPLTALFILIGVKWGALGVALSLAMGRVCVLYPLMYWFVGRKGPVRTRDFYRMVAPFTAAGVSALAACFAYRWLFPAVHPLTGIAVNLGITAVTVLSVLLLLPAGRLALLDVKQTALLLLSSVRRPLAPREA